MIVLYRKNISLNLQELFIGFVIKLLKDEEIIIWS